MDRKLIFLDIDGTLTEPGSNYPPESALKAIRGAQAKGHLVFLCSGRNYAMLSPLLQYGFDGVVASAGGYVTVGDEVIYDHPMTSEQAKTALDALHSQGVFCTVETLDATYGDEDLGSFLADNAGAQGNSEIERWRKALAESLNILPMSQFDGSKPVYKVVIMCMKDEQLQPARDLLEKDFDFVIQEITDPDHPCLNGAAWQTAARPSRRRATSSAPQSPRTAWPKPLRIWASATDRSDVCFRKIPVFARCLFRKMSVFTRRLIYKVCSHKVHHP